MSILTSKDDESRLRQSPSLSNNSEFLNNSFIFAETSIIMTMRVTLGKARPPAKPLRLDHAALAAIQPMFFEVHCDQTSLF